MTGSFLVTAAPRAVFCFFDVPIIDTVVIMAIGELLRHTDEHDEFILIFGLSSQMARTQGGIEFLGWVSKNHCAKDYYKAMHKAVEESVT